MECALFLFLLAAVIALIIVASQQIFGSKESKTVTEIPVEVETVDEDGYVNEVLMDSDGYYYHVSRGHKYTYVNQERPGKWRRMLDEVNVVGTQYRSENVAKFLKARTPWLTAERDSTNEHDPNAIKINGTWPLPNGEWATAHLGYLKREDAATLQSMDIPPSMPMTASLQGFSNAASENGGIWLQCRIVVEDRWCPHCKGDLGHTPEDTGTCDSCGGAYRTTPKAKLIKPA